MKKKIICFISAFILVVLAPLTANAEVYNGGDGWKVSFDGKKMNSTFKSADIDDAVYKLQPGDTVNLKLSLKNSYSETTDWYMTNQVLQSLEKTQSVAEGGAYTYILTYIDPDGKSNVLYSNDVVGGEVQDGAEGLEEATGSLKDYFYLDRLESGESGQITLMVKLEGETQGNEYQDTLAKLQMNFAVEMVKTPKGTTPTPTKKTVKKNKVIRRVKTGDQSKIFLFSALAFISGIICLIVAVYKSREQQERRTQKRRRSRS